MEEKEREERESAANAQERLGSSRGQRRGEERRGEERRGGAGRAALAYPAVVEFA
jgi:hypothetical protein